MKSRLSVVAIFVWLSAWGLTACQPPKTSEKDCTVPATALANPFVGTHRANIMPGACLPFGLVRLSPDVVPPQPTSGYTPHKRIAGFSHTHTSGTGGGPRYGNIMVIPQAGKVDVVDFAALKKMNEYAKPGFYSVVLARIPGDVKAELTASPLVGFHRYAFYTWGKEKTFDANILIDASHTNTRGGKTDSRCTGGSINIVSDSLIVGHGEFAGGWGGQNPYKVYFAALFDTPFNSYGVWEDTLIFENKKTRQTQHADTAKPSIQFGAYARFNVKQHQEIQMKVGISLISTEKARQNLAEIPHWSFDKQRHKADSVWNNHLSRIQIQGGLPEQQEIFYSCLRNTMIMPTDVSGENPKWQSENPHYWDHYCIWDVFRSVMPLHTLILPTRQREILNSLLEIYDKRGWLPDSWVAGDYADVQGGTNADVVFADAIVKKLGGFDKEKAYQAIKKNATEQPDKAQNYGRHLKNYAKKGYVTAQETNGASSRSLEYAYNDFCIAQVAKKLSKNSDYDKFLARSKQIFTLFYDSAKMFWAKDAQGNWQPGFSQQSRRSDSWNDPYFYEGGSQTYSAYVPHDMQGLINRHGGNENFNRFLDQIFDTGKFDLGNEPLFLLPYMYNYTGEPAQTARRVHHILTRLFSPALQGIPGQDDSGAMSSWYVFSAMGFFPVAGQDLYLIGTPLFDTSRIRLENGKFFTIRAERSSPKAIFVQSATLNGKNLKGAWFRHSEIAQGGELVLKLGTKPSGWGKTDLPPSLSAKE